MSALDERPHVYVPAEDESAAGPPLLLLHGTGGDEHDLLPLGPALSPGAAVLSPRGAVREGTMNRFFRRHAEGVLDEDDLRARTDELADFVLAAGREHGIEDGAWMAVGFSNGANIATSLLMHRPEVLAGAVLMAAMVPYATPPTEGDLSQHTVVLSNGRLDPLAPPEVTATLAGQLRALRADVLELPHQGGHSIDPGLLPHVAAVVRGVDRTG